VAKQRYEKKFRFQRNSEFTYEKKRTNLTTDETLNADDEVVRDIFRNRYIIPLDFDVISNHMPLSSHLQIISELKINETEYVLNYWMEKNSSADFIMNNICLEFKKVKDENLLREITRGLTVGVSYLYDHVQHYTKYEVKKKNDLINVDRPYILTGLTFVIIVKNSTV